MLLCSKTIVAVRIYTLSVKLEISNITFVVKFILAQVLTEWSMFSDCSASCNEGDPIRTRNRICSPANLCQSVDVVDTIPCNRQIACPGMWILNIFLLVI